MNYTNVRNPQWVNDSHTAIQCFVTFDVNNNEEVPFTAIPEGDLPHTHEIFARCVAGEFGDIAEYVPPSDEEIAIQVRSHRKALISASDWTQLPDVPQETKDLWSAYRKALRDIPEQVGFPQNVIWPTSPK